MKTLILISVYVYWHLENPTFLACVCYSAFMMWKSDTCSSAIQWVILAGDKTAASSLRTPPFLQQCFLPLQPQSSLCPKDYPLAMPLYCLPPATRQLLESLYQYLVNLPDSYLTSTEKGKSYIFQQFIWLQVFMQCFQDFPKYNVRQLKC